MSLSTDINSIANTMADRIETNGIEYSTNFTRNDLIESLKPGIEASMTSTVNLLIDAFTAGVVVPTDGGASLKTSILSFLNTYKGS